MANRRSVSAIGVAGLLLVVSACGDDGNDSDFAADTTADTEMAMDEAEMADDEMAEMADDEMAEHDEGGEHEDFDFGEPADAADADRVIEIVTDDDFTITPSEMTIAVGETITFQVTNEGNIAHDFTRPIRPAG